MLAEIQKGETGYSARFERHLRHSVEDVWSFLTENDKLAKWFSELSVDELRVGGVIKFDMQDGTFEELTITAVDTHEVLAFTWGEDSVRFELAPEAEGCQLVLKEQIKTLTPHTPKDLAGWHVCLDVIAALLENQELEFREEEWKIWYEKYKRAVAPFT